MLCLQVENLVSIELAYINTKHPDFIEAQIVHKALTEDRDGIKQLRKELQQKQIDEKENRVGTYTFNRGLRSARAGVNFDSFPAFRDLST